jgi:hypothetical protein
MTRAVNTKQFGLNVDETGPGPRPTLGFDISGVKIVDLAGSCFVQRSLFISTRRKKTEDKNHFCD